MSVAILQNENTNNGDVASSITITTSNVSDQQQQVMIDRSTALDALRRSCNDHSCRQAWNSLPDSYKTDLEFILTVLRSAKTLPPKSDFERAFPQHIRQDREVVLAFCARDDFYQLYQERHLFVPGHLTADKQVMLAYCQKIPRSLQECSEELTDDDDVVAAAIALDGMELQYASARLQQNKALVRAACASDGRALEFCPPGQVRNELTADRDFMLSVIQQQQGCGPMLKLISGPLRNDKELLLIALAHGMRFRNVPTGFSSDKSFLLQAVQRKSSVYLELTRSAQADKEIALAAVTAADSETAVHERVLCLHPEYRYQQEVGLAVAKRADLTFMQTFFEQETATYANCKTVMLEAVSRCTSLFSILSPQLASDPDIILVTIEAASADFILSDLSNDIKIQHPAIVIKALELALPSRLHYMAADIPTELWQNRNVVLAWIQRGCRVLNPFEHMVASDRELALAVAKYSWFDFRKVGHVFLNDTEFMLQAIDVNGRVLRHAPLQMKSERNVMIRAMASHPESLLYLPPSRLQQETASMKEYLQSKLDLHRVFVLEFLGGIAIPTPRSPPARRSPLTLLDRGVETSEAPPLTLLDRGIETSEAFKKNIAAFLGVPTGHELTTMRRAFENLQKMPETETVVVTDPAVAEGMELAEVQLARGGGAAAGVMRRMLRGRGRTFWAVRRQIQEQQQQQQQHGGADMDHAMRLERRAIMALQHRQHDPQPQHQQQQRWRMNENDMMDSDDEEDHDREELMLGHFDDQETEDMIRMMMFPREPAGHRMRLRDEGMQHQQRMRLDEQDQQIQMRRRNRRRRLQVFQQFHRDIMLDENHNWREEEAELGIDAVDNDVLDMLNDEMEPDFDAAFGPNAAA